MPMIFVVSLVLLADTSLEIVVSKFEKNEDF